MQNINPKVKYIDKLDDKVTIKEYLYKDTDGNMNSVYYHEDDIIQYKKWPDFKGYYTINPIWKVLKKYNYVDPRSLTPNKICVGTDHSIFHPVTKPSHYNKAGIEAIDAIKASMSDEQFKGYLKGNVEKYIWRKDYKGNPIEDLKKAKWYLDKLISEHEKYKKHD